MGLLDQLGAAGGLLGGGAGQAGGGGQGALVGAVLQMLQNHPGGLGGVLSGFQNAGLGGVAQSWIHDGPNQPVDGGQVSQALGPGPIGEIASRLGVSHDEAAGGLAGVLPQIIDHLSPGGRAPADGGLGGLGGLLSQLGGGR